MLKRFSVFSSGSAVGAAIDYVVTLAASGWLGWDPAYALALAMIVSASVVFLFHNSITFRHSQGNLMRRYVLFMGWSGLILVLRAFLLKASLYAGLPLAAALLVAIGLASIVNFAISSVVIFAKSLS